MGAGESKGGDAKCDDEQMGWDGPSRVTQARENADLVHQVGAGPPLREAAGVAVVVPRVA